MKLDFQHHDIMIFVSRDSDNENMFSMLWNVPWISNRLFQHLPPRQAARAILEHWLSKDDRSEIINKDRWCYPLVICHIAIENGPVEIVSFFP